jgi:CHAT domain
MRVLLDVVERRGEHFAVVTAPGLSLSDLPPSGRPVRWTAGRGLLVATHEQLTNDEADALAAHVDAGTASAVDLERYGALLFDAAFGADTWRQLTQTAAADGAPYLELAIRGAAAAPETQALRWEALHDGAGHVAAKGTTANTTTGGSRHLPVGIVRLITPSPSIIPNGPSRLSPVTRIPRVLFAVGSRLTDPGVRPGAEFMGIMRHLERKGGAIQPRVLQDATVESLAWQLESFAPDVLHVIGHGRRFEVEDGVKLQLRAEPGTAGDAYVTAGQLLEVFERARHVPAMVVLSACQTASAAPVGAGPPAAGPLNSLPFAAELVAGGVPVVVAMAGDISDTACRVFTRALTQAVGDGAPVAKAAIWGRRAAFHAHPGLNSADWLLPAVFLAEHVPGGTRLVDTAAIQAARHRCHVLDLAHEPVFCGRGEFVEAMDRLLDAEDPLNVLVAYTDDTKKSYGGMRLLRELGARAVRAGRLPVLLGPFDDDPPTSLARLAEEIHERLDDMRGYLGLPARPDELGAAALTGPKALALAMRKAFTELVAHLPGDDPVRASPQPRVVLLCHRVDLWDEVVHDLLTAQRAMLGPRGLGAGEHPVPVVLTGADTDELQRARLERCNGAAWAKFAPLGRFRADDEYPEDILAYLWWLLNPPERTPVYAPRRGINHSDWQDMLRHTMRKAAIYDEDELFGWAKAAKMFFTSDTDGDILASYMKAAP